MDWIIARLLIRWAAISLSLLFLFKQFTDNPAVIMVALFIGGSLSFWWEEREIDDWIVKEIGALKKKLKESRRKEALPWEQLTQAERKGRFLDFTLSENNGLVIRKAEGRATPEKFSLSPASSLDVELFRLRSLGRKPHLTVRLRNGTELVGACRTYTFTITRRRMPLNSFRGGMRLKFMVK
ncbi:hypothetical protein EDD75_0392 [Thermodesulfitimonas autotrophica]|uniref:Uncharacterized protein n=1 Tax=Thermodesulfitimonas autotrophica TaxID=1894989 RepID=A0A3N5BUK8_9THEO|nr:hypothetical protein EDD75_0392 [Thermodesulfitimonas autotrophica]